MDSRKKKLNKPELKQSLLKNKSKSVFALKIKDTRRMTGGKTESTKASDKR